MVKSGPCVIHIFTWDLLPMSTQTVQVDSLSCSDIYDIYAQCKMAITSITRTPALGRVSDRTLKLRDTQPAIKSMLPINHLGLVSHSNSLIWSELPSVTRELPLDHLETLHMGTSAAVVEEMREFFSFPAPPSFHMFPDGLWSQTGNLAITNSPDKPSSHSCPPCWLVISSCRKLDASKHKVRSRCLKCHSMAMQVTSRQDLLFTTNYIN